MKEIITLQTSRMLKYLEKVTITGTCEIPIFIRVR